MGQGLYLTTTSISLPTFFAEFFCLNLIDWELSETKKQLLVRVKTQERQAICPICNIATEKIHSHYQRTLADLSWGSIQVDLKLQASKFFCGNQNCSRRIFTQRFPSTVAPWSRRADYLANLESQLL